VSSWHICFEINIHLGQKQTFRALFAMSNFTLVDIDGFCARDEGYGKPESV